MKHYRFTGHLRYPLNNVNIVVYAFNKYDAYFLIITQLINEGKDTDLLTSIEHEQGAVYQVTKKSELNNSLFVKIND